METSISDVWENSKGHMGYRYLWARSPRTKFIWVLLTFTVILIGTLSSLYLKRRGDDLAEQFRERSLWRAQVFAGLAPQHLDTDNWHELFSTIFTASDVLYAQVVYQGRVRAAHGSLPTPAVESLAKDRPLYGIYVPKISEARTMEGQAYLDILYPLLGVGEPPGPDSYVRLGISQAPLEQGLRSEILTVLLIALSALALAGVITWWLAQRLVDLTHSPFPNLIPQPPSLEKKSPKLVVDNAGKRVFLNGAEVKLSPKEYEVVHLLASEPGRVFSNEEILQAVWAGRQWATAQDVKQYIYFIRKKLEADPENPQFILTVRGFGYKLNLD